MCGIAGIFSTSLVERDEIHSLTKSLLHRGPDAQNVFLNAASTMALGHTRLSIIDLSRAADQPMFSEDSRYVIVFNGEIYNYQSIRTALKTENPSLQFKTNSDTETIVHAFSHWGFTMVDKLEGMFAFVIADQKLSKLFFFRDRIGKKPLYYFKSESLFVFASEIKALLKHPVVKREKKCNVNVVTTFLHLGYIPEPHTIYSNIYKFPAGHVGELDSELKFSTKPYWQISDKVNSPQIKTPDEAKIHFDSLLNIAVKKRLISDVPLGAFLSGGTDSSLITAIASKLTDSTLKTFSIGFKESSFDESNFARKVAGHLRTNHTEYILAEKEGIDLLEGYLRHFDEPFADTSAIPTMLVSKLARKDVKVVLTGDGGDELFQGYGAYTWANRLDSIPWKIFRGPLQAALNASGNSRLQRIAHLLQTPVTGGIRSHIFSQEQYLFSQQEICDRLLRDKSIFDAFLYDDPDFVNKNLSGGEKQAIFDLQFYLRDDLLVKVDRSSMYYALECRCPLLDHQIIEYALTLHKTLKIRHGKTKWLLKELLNDHLPPELVDRPKWGFSIPLSKWLKGDLIYLIDDFLNDRIIEEVGLFNSDYIRLLKRDFFSGKEYLYNRLWVIIVLHKWWKENVL